MKLTERLYMLHQAGRDHSQERAELGALVGRPVSAFDIDAAFGSVDPKTFAEGLLFAEVPLDLTTEEMLEMIERICNVKGTPAQHSYWLRCLETNTNDNRISDLIFWPDQYFGDGDVKKLMSPQEILQTALAAGRGR